MSRVSSIHFLGTIAVVFTATLTTVAGPRANATGLAVPARSVSTLLGLPLLAVGQHPVAVAVAQHRAYVVNQGSNDVSVVDVLSQTVITPSVRVGLRPMAAITAGPYVFVANTGTPWGSVSISVLSLAGAVVATIPLAGHPLLHIPHSVAMAVIGNHVYIVDQQLDRVFWLTAAPPFSHPSQPLAPAAYRPNAIAVDVALRRIYVTHLLHTAQGPIAAATLFIANATTGQPIPAPTAPMPIPLGGVGSLAIGVATGGVREATFIPVDGGPKARSYVRILTTASGHLRVDRPVGLHPLAVAADTHGAAFVTSAGTPSITRVDPRLLALGITASSAGAVVVAAYDRLAYVAAPNSSQVLRIKEDSGAIVGTIPVGTAPVAEAVDEPDQRVVVVSSGTGSTGTVSILL